MSLPKLSSFPLASHMRNTVKSLKKLSTEVDVLIHVRDARLPFTDDQIMINQIENLFVGKEKITVWNKADLGCQRSLQVLARRH